jgi:hypothetical protein
MVFFAVISGCKFVRKLFGRNGVSLNRFLVEHRADVERGGLQNGGQRKDKTMGHSTSVTQGCQIFLGT